MMVSTIDAVTQTANSYKTLIENLELSTVDAFRKVLLPGAMPGILTGIDTGITIAFKFLIIVEVFGNSGIGFRIGNSADHMAYLTSYALLIWIGAIGMVLFGTLQWAKKRILHWM
jgi:ABC-type nitrate/sulfonate/bicarbonate transport system permease component